MPRVFSIPLRRSNSLHSNSGNGCEILQTRLMIGVDYVPAYEIIDDGSIDGKELFFIRISQQGLIISHNPSVNLNHLGGKINSLDRNKYLPPSRRLPQGLARNNTLRPVCNRTKSDRCRLIRWAQISFIHCVYPTTMVVILKDLDDQLNFGSNHEKEKLNPQDLKCICFTEDVPDLNVLNANNTILSKLNYLCKEIRFEFLLGEDLKAFITSGLHFKIIEHDPMDSKLKTEERSPLNVKSIDVASSKNEATFFSKLSHWLHKRLTFYVHHRIQTKN